MLPAPRPCPDANAYLVSHIKPAFIEGCFIKHTPGLTLSSHQPRSGSRKGRARQNSTH
jgi:hypothetical protein